MDEKTRNRLALGIGFLAGSTLGYFFASDKGKELRNQANERMSDLGHQLSDTAKMQVEKVTTNLESTIDKGKDFINQLTNKVWIEANESTSTAEEILDEAENKFQEGIKKARQELRRKRKMIDEAVESGKV